MPNPIEWKEADRVETKTIPGATAKLVVRRRYNPRGLVEMNDATPADIVAALAAMGEGERAEVLRELDAGPRTAPSWLSDAAEALGEVRPEDGAPLALNWTQVVRAIYDQRAERDNWRARAEKAERERDKAADRADRFAATAEEWRRETIKVQAERDALRTELRAREWLDAQSNRVAQPTFVDGHGTVFVHASFAGAARALGWEG